MLSTAGDQVPDIPFVEVVGKTKASPLHIAIALNIGTVVGWLTVITKVVTAAHCPASGVNVYVVVVVLSNAGDQLPVNPLFEVVGKADKLPPLQIGVTAVNVGVTGWFTIICKVVVEAH